MYTSTYTNSFSLKGMSILLLFSCFINPSFAIPLDETIVSCNTTFHDDGGAEYPYLEDGSGGQLVDTYTICPDDPSTQVALVSFNEFDVAIGDVLTAYDGLVVDAAYQFHAAVSGSGTGASVSDAPGGGWVQASCENESGCVTLIFERTNDNIKGHGFEVDVRCMTRDIVLECPNNALSYEIACEEGITVVEVAVPNLQICGEVGIWKIITDCEIEGLPLSVSSDQSTIAGTFPIGQHIIRFQSVDYPNMICEAVVHVDALAMACENEVYFSLTGDCTLTLKPEILLEDFCDNEAYEYELSIQNIWDLGGLSITSEGFYVVSLDEVNCEHPIRVQVQRSYRNACNTQEVMDNCYVDVYVQDIIAPYFTGELLDEYDVYCPQDNEYVVDSLNTLANTTQATQLYLASGIELELRDIHATFGNNILDNCDNWTYIASDWQVLYVDCRDDSFGGFDPDGNGIADDVLWDIMQVEFDDPSTFKKYFRTIQVADQCGNLSNQVVQCINVIQPDIVAPVLDIDLPCGTDIHPSALYAAWADGTHPEFATYLPNYDPTPLEVNLGDLDLAGLEDMLFTNDSGDEIPAVVEHSACGYAISWDDTEEIAACGNGYKVFRDWTIYNWCDGHLEYIDVIPQVIKVSDTSAPVLTGKIDYTLGSSHIVDECVAAITFFYPELEEDCSSQTYVSIRMGEEERTFEQDYLEFHNVSIGESVICEITAWDECGNTSIVQDTIFVDDHTPPIAICEQFHTIALGHDCTTEVEAIVFDDGSYDNCGGVIFTVARLDADSDGDGYPEAEDFKPYVTFTPDDLPTCEDNRVSVVLQVEDAAGNRNACVVMAELQDQLPPTALPIYIQLACDEPLADELLDIRDHIEDNRLQRWAISEILLENRLSNSDLWQDNCGTNSLEVVSLDFSDFEGNCKSGVMYFEYQLQDFCGNISSLNEGRVEIMLEHDWAMRFPEDKEFFCGQADGPNLLAPSDLSDILTNNGCDSWALSVEDERFVGEDGACYEIVRNYKLINWCTWNPSHTEVAVVERPSRFIDEDRTIALHYQDEDLDGINDIDDLDDADADIYNTTALGGDADFVLLDYGDAPYADVTVYDAISEFTGLGETYVSAQAYGNLVYRQRIRVYDTGRPTLQLMGSTTHFCSEENDIEEDCLAKVDLTFQIEDACTHPDFLDVQYQIKVFNGAATNDFFGELISLGDGQYQITGDYPLSSNGVATDHTFVISINDACGNEVSQEIPVQINDCTPPTVYCVFGLSADLDTNGEVELWATDFDAGSFDNCTPKAQLRFSFDDPRTGSFMPNRTFRCEDGEIGTVPVRLWVQDLAGNVSMCETFVVTQTNSGDENCATTNAENAMLSGLIRTEGNEAIEGVEVSLSGALYDDKMTGNSGYYAFSDIDFDHDYTIAPFKNDEPLNGVSTFDLVLMSSHILGVEPLDSPYKLLAADINGSGSITTFDMVQLRQLILNLEEDFRNNTSWRFIPANYEFIDPENPWAGFIPEVMSFNNLAEPYLNADFIGIKVGDLNGTAQANDLANVEGRTSVGTLAFELPNTQLASGNSYEIPVRLSDMAQIKGYQFSLSYDTKAIEVVGIQDGIAKAEHFGFPKEGIVTTSWNGTAAGNEPLFYLQIQAKVDATLSEVLAIQDSPTKAEAYTKHTTLLSPTLSFSKQVRQAMLYPNEPNPFEQQTTISFYLPETTSASLEVIDLTGRRLIYQAAIYESGQHQVLLDLSSIKETGVLYYRLSTPHFTQARKMVRL